MDFGGNRPSVGKQKRGVFGLVNVEKISVSLPRDLAAKAEEYADENDLKRSQVVQKALELLLEPKTEDVIWEERVEKDIESTKTGLKKIGSRLRSFLESLEEEEEQEPEEQDEDDWIWEDEEEERTEKRKTTKTSEDEDEEDDWEDEW